MTWGEQKVPGFWPIPIFDYQRYPPVLSPVALLGRQFDVTGALDDERCDGDDDASCESLKMLQRRPAVRSESRWGFNEEIHGVISWESMEYWWDINGIIGSWWDIHDMITIYYNYEWDTMGYRSNKYIILGCVWKWGVSSIVWNWILSPYNWDVMGCTWLSIYPPVSSNMACWKISHLFRWFSHWNLASSGISATFSWGYNRLTD